MGRAGAIQAVINVEVALSDGVSFVNVIPGKSRKGNCYTITFVLSSFHSSLLYLSPLSLPLSLPPSLSPSPSTPEGINAILPNLDLVFVAARLCELEGLTTGFHRNVNCA